MGHATPEQLQQTASFFADLRGRGGQPHHELRPGEFLAHRTHAPQHTFEDMLQAAEWHAAQHEFAAQALRKGQLHDGHDHFSTSGATSYTYSNQGSIGNVS